MAKSKASHNGNGRLEDALRSMLQARASLLQTQAAFQAEMAAFGHRMDDFARRMDEHARRMDDSERITAERFRRIEVILLDHSRVLERLPEAVREKIGFKPPQ
jgi:hypothetical protein